ncbi:MAG TPA: DUF2959 family protein [Planctomycetota bacterium]|nr:DUF2959 family protein [Planctomycetota bacterium]
MLRRNLLARNIRLLSLSLALCACTSTEKREGLTRVDDLLTRVEQVQIESLVAREKASAAFDAFGQIVAPEFRGDPMLVYAALVERIHASKLQAERLESCVEPMKRTADGVFLAWTRDLEQFGNTNLRQASQARLAETRTRYSSVHDAATAALVSINAFNSDLNDQALFLEHDFNAAAVSVIAREVPGLKQQAQDLGKRLNVCARAAREYIAASALRGQVEPVGSAPAGEAAPQTTVAASEHDAAQPEVGANDSAASSADTAPITLAPARRRPRADGTSAQPAPTPGTQPTALTPSAKPLAAPASKPVAPPVGSGSQGGGR